MYTPKISTFNDSTKYQQLNDFFFQTFTNYTFSINSFIFFLLMILSTQFYSYISRNVSTFWFEFQISVIVRWRKTISVKSITLLNNSKVDSGHITACAVKVELKVGFLQEKGHDTHCASFSFFLIPSWFAHAMHWECQRCSKAQMSLKKHRRTRDSFMVFIKMWYETWGKHIFSNFTSF